MAEIIPFKGLLYNLGKVRDINKVIAPPWDVIDNEYEKYLHSLSPYNIINLIGKNNNPEEVADLFYKWIEEKILIEDEGENFYFMRHIFSYRNRKYERKGFFTLLKLEDFSSGTIIPHEQIFEQHHQNRYKLIEKCRANFSPVFMLYEDEKQRIEELIESEEGILEGEIKDEKFLFGKIKNEKKKKEIQNILRKNNLYIADGHHRYYAALRFYKNNPSEKNSYVMIFLVNLLSPGLVILPTHRYIPDDFTLDFYGGFREYFEVKEVENIEKVFEIMEKFKKQHAFGIFQKEKFYVVVVKEMEKIEKYLPQKNSHEWRTLDTVILHEFIMKKFLKDENIECLFHSSPEFLLKEYKKRKRGIIFFLNPVEKNSFIKICSNGEIMPPKSTYFYPKVPSGLVLHKFQG